MNMKEAGSVFILSDKYRVTLPPGEYLTVVMGVAVNSPSAKFEHPNLAGKVKKVFEFKHYRTNGSKFWTAKPGVEFYFLVPKDKIELVPDEGHSYVPIVANGVKMVLDVSGMSSSDGWTDMVRSVAHTGYGAKVKELKAVAEVAVKPESVGEKVEVKEMNDEQSKRFEYLLTASTTKLELGDEFYLEDGYSYAGSKGPFTVFDRSKDKGSVLAKDASGSIFKATKRHINWLKIKKASEAEVPA